MPTVRLTLVVVGTAAYVGLAVLGWGGLAAFFSHPALVALAAEISVLAGASLFAGGSLSPGVREDRGNRWVIVAFALVGLPDAYLPAYTIGVAGVPLVATIMAATDSMPMGACSMSIISQSTPVRASAWTSCTLGIETR